MSNKLYWSANVLFIIYWTTRINPIIKFLATFTLSFYEFKRKKYFKSIQLLYYSIGDYLIEIYPDNISLSIFFFMNGKFLEIRYYYIPLLCFASILIMNTKLILIILFYMITHTVCLYNSMLLKNYNMVLSNILYILSDCIIGWNLLITNIKNSEYISYLLYWLSNII